MVACVRQAIGQDGLSKTPIWPATVFNAGMPGIPSAATRISSPIVMPFAPYRLAAMNWLFPGYLRRWHKPNSSDAGCCWPTRTAPPKLKAQVRPRPKTRPTMIR
jgi:hypothetical protein